MNNEPVDDTRAAVPPQILTMMYRLDELLAAVPTEHHERIIAELIEEAEQRISVQRAKYPNYLALATKPFQMALDLYMNALLPRFSLPSRSEVGELAKRLVYIEQRLGELQSVQAIPERMGALEQRMGELDTHTSAGLQALPDRLGALEQRLGELQSVQAIPERMGALEQRMGELDDRTSQNLQALAEQLAQVTTSITDQGATQIRLDKRLQTIDTNIKQLRERPKTPKGKGEDASSG